MIKEKLCILAKYRYLLFTLCVLCVIYVALPIYAETNDDPSIMGYVSGFFSGSPGVLPYLMGVPYTFIISRLYMLTGLIPWYGLAFVIINSLAVLAISFFFTRDFANKQLLYFLVFLGMFTSLMLYELVEIQFTMVAGISGAASVFIIDIMSKKNSTERAWVEGALAVFFAFLSYNIRYNCGYVTLVVMIYIIVSRFFLLKEKNRNQVLTVLACTGIVFISYLSNSLYVRSTDWRGYTDLQKQRALYMDYQRIPFEGNEETYSKIGWDSDTYALISRWCFMTDSANGGCFKYLNRLKDEQMRETVTMRERLGLFLDKIQKFKQEQPIDTKILIVEFVLLMVCLIRVCYNKITGVGNESDNMLIYLSGFFVIEIILVGYFIYIDRYGSRVLLMVFNICSLPFFYHLTEWLDSKMVHGVGKVVLFIALTSMIIGGIRRVDHREIPDYGIWDTVFEYVRDNKPGFYIGDASMATTQRLFQSFSDGTGPTNYAFWGGWLSGSPLYNKQLEANGLDELKLDDMLMDNMYYIGCKEYDTKDYMTILNSYYNRYENVNCLIYHETDDFVVYGFRLAD